MANRYVWNRYNIETNYEWKSSSKSSAYTNQAEVQTANAAYLIGFEHMPTIDGATNRIRYTGRYHIIDVANSGTSSSTGRTPVSTYPYATIFCPYDDYNIENSNVNTSSGDHTAGSGSSALRLRVSYGWNGYIYENQSGSGYWIIDGSSAEGADIDIFIGSNPDSSSHNGSRIYRNYIASVSSQGPTLQGTVSNASSGAYPSNGSSGSNWYVYQGSDVIDPASVSIPASIQGGTSIDITVTPSTGKKYGGTVSYTYQYKLDNGGWQALSGPTTATTQQLTVPKGTASVQVQVRAQDNLGFTSSTWVASASVEVTNNEPPTAPGSIDVTNTVAGGQATITLTAATDPDGTIASYRYERSVDGGQWQQFADVNSLTQTDQIGEDWGEVAYRACAVDDSGVAGPYVTSDTKTINSGYLMIGGPVSNMGVKSIPFDFEATVGVSGETSITGIEATMWLDHTQVYHESVNQGATIEYHVDTRVMSSGQHTIQVTLEKDDYLSANAAYYFTVPSQGLPDGGMSVQLEDDHGNPLFPRTTTRDVIGPSGKTVQNEIEDLQKAHLGTTGHLEHIDTVLGPASNIEWPRKANTAYASRYYGTSNETIAYNRLLPSGASGAITIGGASLNLAADSITLTNLSSNAMLELLKYVLDTHAETPPDLTVNFTPLDQPKVLTAATNTGITATDLQNALRQIIDTYPTQNLYMIEDAESSDTVYYVACVDTIDADTTSKTCAYVVSTNSTKWYQGVTLTFVDSSNPAKSFTQLSGNYASEITTAGTGSDKGSQNAALIALLRTNKGYYYKFTDCEGTVYYMASSTAISMSGDSVTANCDYVKNAETTVYTGGTISFNSVPDAPNWNVGQVVTFAGLQWIVSHKTSSECYLTAQTLQDRPSWNNLQTTCQNFANTQLTENQKAFLKQIGAGNTSGYVFVATYDQMNGDFSYFNSNSRRSAGDVYWTSTELGSSAAWSVNAAGVLGPTPQSYSLRFRPSICFDLTKL